MCMCLCRVGFCRNREELYHYVGMGPAPESEFCCVRLGSFENKNKNQPAVSGHGLVGEELSQAPNFTFSSLFGTKF